VPALVLFFLRDGPKRYGQLKRLVQGVRDKVLIQQLKDLEADRVVARTDYKEVPPRVDYALKPLRRSLADAIVPLCTWGTENAAEMASIFAKQDALSSGCMSGLVNPFGFTAGVSPPAQRRSE